MTKDTVTGRDRQVDAAEAWLAEHDPEYATRKRNWQTPSTDALARDRSIHGTLADLVPIEPRGDGNYYRRRARAEEEQPFEYSDVDDVEPSGA